MPYIKYKLKVKLSHFYLRTIVERNIFIFYGIQLVFIVDISLLVLSLYIQYIKNTLIFNSNHNLLHFYLYLRCVIHINI